MFERILKHMREKIRTRLYVMTLHAEEEMSDDGLTVYDVERAVLTGEILERQKNTVTAEWKYRIRGESVQGDRVEVIAKLSATGKLVIITVYLL
jgi:arginyl-tRNA--protein-N-Asp/Glu arginylyltransferase